MSKKNKGMTEQMVPEEIYYQELLATENVRILRRLLYWMILFCILVTGVVYVAWTTRPQSEYQVIQDGKVLPNVPISQPINNSAQAAAWLGEELRSIFSFDFVHYKEQVESHKISFTLDGWTAFLAALNDSKFVQSVRENRQVVSATPTSAPRVVAEGTLGGRYTWKIEQTFLFTFYAGQQSQSQQVKISATVVRVPTYENPSGLGIQQLIQESTR